MTNECELCGGKGFVAAAPLSIKPFRPSVNMAIVNCELCDDAGYRGVVVCDHVNRVEVARRGLEKCWRVLNRKKGH